MRTVFMQVQVPFNVGSLNINRDFEQLEGTAADDINTGCSLLAVKSKGHNRHENKIVSVMSFFLIGLLILTTLKIKLYMFSVGLLKSTRGFSRRL